LDFGFSILDYSDGASLIPEYIAMPEIRSNAELNVPRGTIAQRLSRVRSAYPGSAGAQRTLRLDAGLAALDP
jgi:hypothetical protein